MVIQGWFYKVLDWPLVENPSFTDQIQIMKSIRQGPCPEPLPLPVRLGESIDLRFRDLLHFSRMVTLGICGLYVTYRFCELKTNFAFQLFARGS